MDDLQYKLRFQLPHEKNRLGKYSHLKDQYKRNRDS